MGTNELIPIKKLLPAKKNNIQPILIYPVRYEAIDPGHFSFDCEYNDTVDIHMSETERKATYSEFIDVEYADYMDDSYKPYVAMAAVIGATTGIMGIARLDWDKLTNIDKRKDRDWNKIIVSVARLIGFKGTDSKKAINLILNRGVNAFNEKILNDKNKENFNRFSANLASHPTSLGLVFSIFSQYGGMRYSIDNGVIKSVKQPSYYAIGRNDSEKILLGILYWLFNVIVDSMISKRDVLNSLRIPKPVLEAIKIILKTDMVKDIPMNIDEAEKEYSKWIKNIIEKTSIVTDAKSKDMFDFSAILEENMGDILNQAVTVVLNECLTRVSYSLYRFSEYIKHTPTKSLDDLKKLDFSEILPVNNRIVLRMCTVSSGVYAGINIAGAVIKALIKCKVNKRDFMETFLTEINIAGVGRFFFACGEDMQYWGEDIKIKMEKIFSSKTGNSSTTGDDQVDIGFDELFKSFGLDFAQAQILYSIENLAIQYDIDKTKDREQKELKQEWRKEWIEAISKGLRTQSDKYFIADEDLLYNGLFELGKHEENKKWLHLIAMELALFKPYTPIGSSNDKDFVKLKYKNNYLEDRYVRRQTLITQAELDAIIKEYKKYKGLVSGETQGRIVGVSSMIVAVVASGGLAFTFAPQIAIALAGEAVAGLHGAALTAASLAAVGGGSLAAGGLGMAGGTAIITGGGAILGLAGGGAASIVALSQTSKEYRIRQYSKLVTFADGVLISLWNDTDSVKALIKKIDQVYEQTERTCADIVAEDNDLDKEIIKDIRDSMKYMGRTRKELEKIVEKALKGNAKS